MSFAMSSLFQNYFTQPLHPQSPTHSNRNKDAGASARYLNIPGFPLCVTIAAGAREALFLPGALPSTPAPPSPAAGLSTAGSGPRAQRGGGRRLAGLAEPPAAALTLIVSLNNNNNNTCTPGSFFHFLLYVSWQPAKRSLFLPKSPKRRKTLGLGVNFFIHILKKKKKTQPHISNCSLVGWGKEGPLKI